MKKLLISLIVLGLVCVLMGCANSDQNPHYRQGEDLTGLEIGDTANYATFSITLLNVEKEDDNQFTAQFEIEAYSDVLFESKEFSGVGSDSTSQKSSFYIVGTDEHLDSFMLDKSETATIELNLQIKDLHEIIFDHDSNGEIVESSWTFSTDS